MSENEYNEKSYDAVLSRIETKLDGFVKVQEEQQTAINRIWRALSRLDVRVTAIAGGISAVVWIVELIWKR